MISVLELEMGVLQVERRDPSQGAVLRRWLEQRVLAVDVDVARRCATLRVPDPRSDRDAIIAATALVRGMAIATRNVADFAPTGAVTENPWDEP